MCCLQGRGGGRAALRCGRCQPCLRPSMHKACLNPIAAQPTGAFASDNPNAWWAVEACSAGADVQWSLIAVPSVESTLCLRCVCSPLACKPFKQGLKCAPQLQYQTPCLNPLGHEKTVCEDGVFRETGCRRCATTC